MKRLTIVVDPYCPSDKVYLLDPTRMATFPLREFRIPWYWKLLWRLGFNWSRFIASIDFGKDHR